MSLLSVLFSKIQGKYFLNIFLDFFVRYICPRVTSLIAAYLRNKALNDGTPETLYKVSQIISLFLIY